jgi:hypothetical protein
MDYVDLKSPAFHVLAFRLFPAVSSNVVIIAKHYFSARQPRKPPFAALEKVWIPSSYPYIVL